MKKKENKEINQCEGCKNGLPKLIIHTQDGKPHIYCTSVVPPEEKLRELTFPDVKYDVSELVKEGIKAHNARLAEMIDGMHKENLKGKTWDEYAEGYNDARRDFIKILKESNLQE